MALTFLFWPPVRAVRRQWPETLISLAPSPAPSFFLIFKWWFFLSPFFCCFLLSHLPFTCLFCEGERIEIKSNSVSTSILYFFFSLHFSISGSGCWPAINAVNTVSIIRLLCIKTVIWVCSRVREPNHRAPMGLASFESITKRNDHDDNIEARRRYRLSAK